MTLALEVEETRCIYKIRTKYDFKFRIIARHAQDKKAKPKK